MHYIIKQVMLLSDMQLTQVVYHYKDGKEIIFQEALPLSRYVVLWYAVRQVWMYFIKDYLT